MLEPLLNMEADAQVLRQLMAILVEHHEALIRDQITCITKYAARIKNYATQVMNYSAANMDLQSSSRHNSIELTFWYRETGEKILKLIMRSDQTKSKNFA